MTAPTLRNAVPNETILDPASTTITMVAPPGLANSDVMYALIVVADGTTITPPTGWVQVTNQTSDHDGGRSAIFFKVAASESGNYDFTISSSRAYGIIWAVVGADTAAPNTATPAPATGSGTGPDSPASGTVASDDYLAISAFGQEGKSVAIVTPPAGYVENQAGGTSGAGAGTGHAGGGLATLGLTAQTAEDPGAFLSSTNDGWAAFTILVKPVEAIVPDFGWFVLSADVVRPLHKTRVGLFTQNIDPIATPVPDFGWFQQSVEPLPIPIHPEGASVVEPPVIVPSLPPSEEGSKNVVLNIDVVRISGRMVGY